MKYLDEYRDAGLCRKLLKQIKARVSEPVTIMEICGGQTHSLVRNGLLDLLPPEVSMVHGPGCPVCVTSPTLIDDAIELALEHGVILCSFGDMLRVPGSKKSLLEAKSEGADVRMVYSPLEAVGLAGENPDKQVVFFAVGFETTAPANALALQMAAAKELTNFSMLASHVLVPPAMVALLEDPDCHIDAFLAAGHVCTIMGMEEYLPIAKEYQVPIVITGFEPVDLLQGILMAVEQTRLKDYTVTNQYDRVVAEKGNTKAIETITNVYSRVDRDWRGLGVIPQSGLDLRPEYATFNARTRFGLGEKPNPDSKGCLSGAIMKGQIKPTDCPLFGKECSPQHPVGAPMVSSEGACAAYFHFHQMANHV